MLDFIASILVLISAGVLLATSVFLLAVISERLRNSGVMTKVAGWRDFWAFHGGELALFLCTLLTILYIMEMIEEHPQRQTYLVTDMFVFGTVCYCLHRISVFAAYLHFGLKSPVLVRKILLCTLWLLLAGTSVFILEDFITKGNYYIITSVIAVMVTIIQLRWMQTFMSVEQFLEAATNSSIIGIPHCESTEG